MVSLQGSKIPFLRVKIHLFSERREAEQSKLARPSAGGWVNAAASPASVGKPTSILFSTHHLFPLSQCVDPIPLRDPALT
jgi:hypothetical protein